MKLLLVGTSFFPRYGGPAYSVPRLAEALSDLGFDVALWAPDGSAKDSVGKSNGALVRRLGGTIMEAIHSFGLPDILHDNGLWLLHNHQLQNLASKFSIPRVVSPRGMLEPWALKHKHWKKRIAWAVYQRRDLDCAQYIHATAESEADSVRNLYIKAPCCIIPNGIDLPKNRSAEYELNRPESNNAVFLGRLYPVKGLPMLLEAWAKVRPKGWTLKIAGPDEAGHRSELERAVRQLNLTANITFIGAVSGEDKRSLLFESDLFILPTHSESFGMAIGEALAHQLPVLTTKGAPWPMLPALGCGWWVDPTVDGIMAGLREATSHDRNTLAAMGAIGRNLISAQFSWTSIASDFSALYKDII